MQCGNMIYLYNNLLIPPSFLHLCTFALFNKTLVTWYMKWSKSNSWKILLMHCISLLFLNSGLYGWLWCLLYSAQACFYSHMHLPKTAYATYIVTVATFLLLKHSLTFAESFHSAIVTCRSWLQEAITSFPACILRLMTHLPAYQVLNRSGCQKIFCH